MDPKYGHFGTVYMYPSYCEKRSDLLVQSSSDFKIWLSPHVLREIFIMTRNQSSLKHHLLLPLKWFVLDSVSLNPLFSFHHEAHIMMPKLDMDLYEWMHKTSLHEQIKAFSKLVLQLTFGLFVLHQRRISHRDLKCTNILVKHSETLPDFSICDFGLSGNQRSVSGINYEQHAVGTPWYVAPELLQSALYPRDIAPTVTSSYSSDIWALGIILLESLFGLTFHDILTWKKSPSFPTPHPFHNTWLYCHHPDNLHPKLKMRHWFADLWKKLLLYHQNDQNPMFSHDPKAELAFQFLESILRSNYDQRPSAWQLLQHPFIQKSEILSTLYMELLQTHEKLFEPNISELGILPQLLFDKEATSKLWKTRHINAAMTQYAASLYMTDVHRIIPFGPHRWKHNGKDPKTMTKLRVAVYVYVEVAIGLLFRDKKIPQELPFAIGDYLDYFLSKFCPLVFCQELFDWKDNYFWTATVVIYIILQWFFKKEDINLTTLLTSFGWHLMKTHDMIHSFSEKKNTIKLLMMNYSTQAFFCQGERDIIDLMDGKMMLIRLEFFPYLTAKEHSLYSKTDVKVAFELFVEYFLSIKL